VRLKVERSPRRLFNALVPRLRDGFAAEYLRLRRVNWHRLRDKTIHLGCPSARPRHGEQAPVVPCLFFRFAQDDHITNQIAQMRFRIRYRERFAADEYCFDHLLSQMTAPFQNFANTFGARPFGAAS
jgi:hypothetical protein